MPTQPPPEHVIDDLITILGLDPTTLAADTRSRFAAVVAREVDVAANATHDDTMRIARTEAMDCLHGTDRPGGLDGRFAGPLGLVRALAAEVYRLRGTTGPTPGPAIASPR